VQRFHPDMHNTQIDQSIMRVFMSSSSAKNNWIPFATWQ
jgi:hypothetical protein